MGQRKQDWRTLPCPQLHYFFLCVLLAGACALCSMLVQVQGRCTEWAWSVLNTPLQYHEIPKKFYRAVPFLGTTTVFFHMPKSLCLPGVGQLWADFVSSGQKPIRKHTCMYASGPHPWRHWPHYTTDRFDPAIHQRGLFFTNVVWQYMLGKMEGHKPCFLSEFAPEKCSCFPSWRFEARDQKTGERQPIHIDVNDKYGPSLCVMEAAPGQEGGVVFCTEDGVWQIPSHSSGKVLVGMFSGDRPHGTVCVAGARWWGWTAVQHRPNIDPKSAKVPFSWQQVGPMPATLPPL